MSSSTLQIDLRLGSMSLISGSMLAEKMLEVRPAGLVVEVSEHLRATPSAEGDVGFLVATGELEEARRELVDSELSRFFFLGSTAPPQILEDLEKFEMPGAVWAHEWFKLRDLESPFRGYFRREVAGLESLEGFESENYGWYSSGVMSRLMLNFVTVPSGS